MKPKPAKHDDRADVFTTKYFAYFKYGVVDMRKFSSSLRKRENTHSSLHHSEMDMLFMKWTNELDLFREVWQGFFFRREN